jgi:hypothetical protein
MPLYQLYLKASVHVQVNHDKILSLKNLSFPNKKKKTMELWSMNTFSKGMQYN